MKLLFAHLLPIEQYPPIINLIRTILPTLSESDTLHIYTSRSGGSAEVKFDDPRVKVIRFSTYKLYRSKIGTYFSYSFYYLFSLLRILHFSPNKILYFETLSSFAPLVYSFLNHRCRIMVHYHEYMSRKDYQNSSLNNLLHELEIKCYKKLSWISHTNEDRMKFFLRDISIPQHLPTHILPNYPPHKWTSIPKVKHDDVPTKFVYVGALDLHSMYLIEFAEWIKSQPNLCWHIYSQQVRKDIANYFESLNAGNIYFHGGVEYDELPCLLVEYEIGVMLYKGLTENFKFNAPNKLFEYLACGLDVIFPQEMQGSFPYLSNDKPIVRAVDFTKLDFFPLSSLISPAESESNMKRAQWTCEVACKDVIKTLLN